MEDKKDVNKDVLELARKLDGWAKSLPEEQQTLLRWLLSRGAYMENRDDEHVIGRAAHVFEVDIKLAVQDALGPLIKVNFDNPTEGWARFSPTWPRFSPTWPRDGYWALGIGRPPKIGKRPPEGPILPIGPDKTPPGGPENPPL